MKLAYLHRQNQTHKEREMGANSPLILVWREKMNRRQRERAMAFMDEVEKDRAKREKKAKRKAKTKGKVADELRTTKKRAD